MHCTDTRGVDRASWSVWSLSHWRCCWTPSENVLVHQQTGGNSADSWSMQAWLRTSASHHMLLYCIWNQNTHVNKLRLWTANHMAVTVLFLFHGVDEFPLLDMSDWALLWAKQLWFKSWAVGIREEFSLLEISILESNAFQFTMTALSGTLKEVLI